MAGSGEVMRKIEDFLPWEVTLLPIRPFDGMWSFNPSIHFDGVIWRCVLRCADYAMPDGVTVRSSRGRLAGTQTRNALVTLDPHSWEPLVVHEMRELDGLTRVQCANRGYEDVRLFRTSRGGLQGIAASLHLERGVVAGAPASQVPEQVLLTLHADTYDVVDARPIRGAGWSGTPQKNWVPFDHAEEACFLQSIPRGTLFGEHGPLRSSAVEGSTAALTADVAAHGRSDLALAQKTAQAPGPRDHRVTRVSIPRHLTRGRRLALDALASRASGVRRVERSGGAVVGRALPLRYAGLRGGSQLEPVGEDAWLGIGHEMKFVGGRKYYWHIWYLVDSTGKMTSSSLPMKLADGGIEFAAGMAIDGDRVVVSYGVDDMECRLGETRLSAVLRMLASTEASSQGDDVLGSSHEELR